MRSQFGKLNEIDDGIALLDPTLEEFCSSHDFVLSKSHEGTYWPPQRWLVPASHPRQKIGIAVAALMPERLELDFHSMMPCSLYIQATSSSGRENYAQFIVEAQPYDTFSDQLIEHLQIALTKLRACTPEFVEQHGNAVRLSQF